MAREINTEELNQALSFLAKEAVYISNQLIRAIEATPTLTDPDLLSVNFSAVTQILDDFVRLSRSVAQIADSINRPLEIT